MAERTSSRGGNRVGSSQLFLLTVASHPPKSRALGLVAAVLALLLAAAWLFRSGENTGSAVEPENTQGNADEGDGEIAPDPVSGLAREETHPSVDPVQSPVDAGAQTAAAFEGLIIRVVVGATGDPVPGIDVVMLDRRWIDGDGLLLAIVRDNPRALLDRCGRCFPTDARGIAHVPRPSPLHGALAFAQSEGHFGALEISGKGPDELELRLAPDPEVSVRVVGPARDPIAGVEVVLRGSDEDRVLGRATSDENGLAVLKGWNAQLYPREEVRVGLAVVTPEPIEAAFERNAPPVEPIELILPAFGRVEVEIKRPDDESVGDGFLVKLAPRRGPGQLGQHSIWYVEPGKGLHAIASQGRALFDHVPLGQRALEVAAFGPGFGLGTARCDGPVAPVETVTVRVELGAPTTLAVGRVVEPTGQRVANRRLDVQTILRRTDGGASAYDELATDATGRFRCTLPTDTERPDWFEVELTLEQDDGSRVSASFDLPGDVPVGETDVGTLVLGDAPVLVAGIVVDERDRPVPGVIVSCKELWEDGSQRGTVWSWPPNARVRSHDDGSFVIQARSHLPTVYVETRREGYFPLEEVEASVGQTDLRLVLQESASKMGAVVGHVLVNGSSVDGIQIMLRASDSGTSTAWTLLGTTEFRFPDVVAGAHTLECRFWPERRELARVEGIEVVAGEITRDPRLDPLDLRGLLRTFRVRVVGEDGRALPAFGLARRQPGESDYGYSDWSSYDEATREVATTSPVLDLYIEAIGKRSVELLAVEGDCEVVLGPGIPVRIVLQGELPALPEAASVVLSLHSKDRKAGVVAVHEVPLDAAGGADLLVGEAGAYRLQIEVQVPSAYGFRASRRLRGGAEFDVEVHDTPDAEVITRTIPIDAWHEALRELGIEATSGD